MALGDVTTYPGGAAKSIVVLASATATNSAPSGASAGIAVADIANLFNQMPVEAALLVYSTAGSGTMTATFRLWGYHPGPAAWFPIGTGTDALKGVINEETALGETGANAIAHCEPIALLGVIGSRLYVEITAIGGTSTAVEAAIVVRRGYAS
jgi:hypothetical protein